MYLLYLCYTVSELSMVLRSLETCLSATNMLIYLEQEGLLKKAKADAEFYLARIRDFIPSKYLKTFSNHCWKIDVHFQVNNSTHLITGKYGSQTFSFHDELNDNKRIVSRKGFLRNSNHALPLACVPEVFLAGFPKCGSTYLYDQLTSHPSVVTPTMKELHWWVIAEHFTSEDSKRNLYFVEYILNYENLVQELLQHRSKSRLVSVDSSPLNMFTWPLFYHNRRGVNYCLLPAILPTVLPLAKFLVVMRNPTDMLYSAFWHSCTRQGGVIPNNVQPKGPDIFHERILQKIKDFRLCNKNQTAPLAKCALDTFPNTFSSALPCGNTKLYIGLYCIHIQKWLSVVPQSRFLFLTLEELSADTNGAMAKVWDFLDFPHMSLHPVTKSQNQQVKVDYRHNPQLAMREDTRILMDEFFAPYNRMLAHLIGDDKFLWSHT